MNFVVNLDKRRGITSQDAVSRVKRLLHVKKAGHAGTLDPLATGVLLVCLGEATKITRFLTDMEKEYVVVMKFGEKTDTLDADGTVVSSAEVSHLQRTDVEDVLGRFTGDVRQTPPMYSAIKIKGEPLYKLARKGIEIDRAERAVFIRSIGIEDFSLPFLKMRISCSKGTYVRTLCDDLGDLLGVGGHVVELRRTRVGSFSIGDSLPEDELERLLSPDRQGGKEVRGSRSIEDALAHLAAMTLTAPEFDRARHGLPLRKDAEIAAGDGFVRLLDPEGKLFAIGTFEASVVRIERMLHL